ncbi:hypothetical protein [Pseudomonas helleri]|uniref:hypothetical protein n=1 Tax=Pseudomonas helleri TaxID=1608996 RepID=UPI003FCFCCBA
MSAKHIKLITATIASTVCITVFANESDTGYMANTVNEMLRIDADRAIISEKKMLMEAQSRFAGNQGSNNIPEQNKVAQEETPKEDLSSPVKMEVLGIFGLGENLLVDMSIDNYRVRFKRGISTPLGASADFPYRLVSINVPCVKISDQKKIVHNTCLSKSGL